MIERTLLLGAFCLLLSWGTAASTRPETEELARTNRLLQEWLALIEADSLHLVVDRQAGEIRLQHGGAVLRNCPLLVDSLTDEIEALADLEMQLRRYRPSDPWSEIVEGPYDWEQNLVTEATDACALYFGNALIVYAAEAWSGTAGPTLRIAGEDLRALFQACPLGTFLVILPEHWNEEITDE